jgi:hypothetical protein
VGSQPYPRRRGTIVDRKKAEAVLKAVETKYAEWIALSKADGINDADCYPQLVANWWGYRERSGRPAPFAVSWEVNSPDNWAVTFSMEQEGNVNVPDGVHCEAEFSFVLGVHDNDEFDWNRVKRGSKFVHQRAIDRDGQPVTCWITKVSRVDDGIDVVWYRHENPKTGFLSKCSAEFFADKVLSFWED